MLKSTRSSRRADACASKRNGEASADTTSKRKGSLNMKKKMKKTPKMFLELHAVDDAAKRLALQAVLDADAKRGKNS